MSATDVFIVSAARTPIGNFNGSFANIKASELGSKVIRAVLERANIGGDIVDEVIVGQTLTAGQGQNPARQAAIAANIPVKVPAYTVNMLCGSGLKSVVLGFQAIRCGDSNIIVSVGQENMSLSPHCLHMRNGIKMGDGTFVDSMIKDGLTDAMENIHMGVTAENLATKYNISREEQDKYAASSQLLTENAQKNKYFKDEIIPIIIKKGKSETCIENDEFPRHGATVEQLACLKPCFINDGTVTPGNSSGVNDSASAVLLMSSTEVSKRGLKPLAKIVGWAQCGLEPKFMGIGPAEAVVAVLLKCGWNKHDVDLYELNEAFAAQALAVNKTLDVDPNKINISGGAIALGHPIGASGNRILVTLLYALKRKNKKRGIAGLCIGGGMGIAMAIERDIEN